MPKVNAATSTNALVSSPSLLLFFVILLIVVLPHLSTDMYVPSLPSIAEAFSTSPTTVQLSLTTFMAGYSFMHLVYGPLSDRFGRRPSLLTGIALSSVGTALCIFAGSIDLLILGRFIQGIGTAACNAIGRSVVRDVVSGAHLAQVSSYLGMAIVLVLTSAPTLGGFLQYYFDWRAVFVFLLMYTVFVLLLIIRYLPETNRHMNPHALQWREILKSYAILLTSRTFLGYTLCVSCAYAGVIAYATYTPFLMQSVLKLNPKEFGYLAFITGTGIFISFLVNSRMVAKKGIDYMLAVGISSMLISSVVMWIAAHQHIVNVTVIVLPAAFFCMGAGFVFSNAPAGALQPFAKIAGSAGGLFGFLQITGGVASSAIMAHYSTTSQQPLAVFLVTIAIICLISFCGTRLTHSASNDM